MNAIETEALTKQYGALRAVDGLNLIVPQGTVFGLLGPNGAGKTTAMSMLLGNVRPTSGRAILLGQPIGNIRVRKRVGFLPEKFQFFPFLTAKEFLKLQGRLSGLKGSALEARIGVVLELVGLQARAGSRLGEFSRGMQQRIGLAQAILHDPELVILDEPTSALDPAGRRDVRQMIDGLREQGRTVLLNSHMLSEVEATCDRVAILKQGKLIAEGAPGELRSFACAVEVEVEAMNDPALQAVRKVVQKLRLERVPITRFTATLQSESDIPELAAALVENGVRLRALIPKRETMEEAYLRIVGGENAPSL
ncbi:MAG: ABC-type multidrug transport system, ATPase component [Chthonomonadaceae bacterium]|nr:ABC-type multidrug transport system, ATPase component [Chthonomonadaceae bacterium]